MAQAMRSSLRKVVRESSGFLAGEGGSLGLSRGIFSGVEQAPKDPILGITENFLADSNPNKINLGVVRLKKDC